jgi:hypothetical protein
MKTSVRASLAQQLGFGKSGLKQWVITLLSSVFLFAYRRSQLFNRRHIAASEN